jgi:hypothetical protein
MLKTRYINIQMLHPAQLDRTGVKLSREFGEAFGFEIVRWQMGIVAQMLHPYGWFELKILPAIAIFYLLFIGVIKVSKD